MVFAGVSTGNDVIWKVTGLPAGASTDLTISGSGVSLTVTSASCAPSGKAYTCTITTTSDTGIVNAVNNGANSGTVSFDIAVPSGYTDSDLGNNSASVTIP